MRYVLDSCVAFKWVVAEPLAAKAQCLRADFQNAVHKLLAPDVFPIEVAHALTKAEHQGRVSPSQGGLLWADVMTTPPQFFPYLPLVPRAYQIASQAKVGIYDCLYIALAEREGCSFVTTDDRLVRNLQPRYPVIVALASLP